MELANPLASYARGSTDTPLIEATIGDFFADMARRQPDSEALVSRHQGLRYSYAQLHQQARRLASALLGLGLTPGDRIGIWSHNNAEWVLMQLATAQVGLILVNINPAYRTAEVEYAMNKVGCKALVTMAQFKTSDYLGMLRELAPELALCRPGLLASKCMPELRTVVWIDVAGEGEEQPGMLRFSDLMARGDAQDARIAAIAPSLKNTDPINIQFTSGTTGFPKGATLTHRNILNNGFFIGECMRLTPADRLCIPVPLYHCFGMVLGNLACITHGSTIVYPNDGFDPLSVLETVQAERCTGLHGVPTMFIAELDHPRFRVRPEQPAHRHHGRQPLPDRGHEARAGRHAHDRGDHCLRHDGDQPRQLPERRRHAPGKARLHRRPGAAAPGGEDRRPRDRRQSWRAASAASCARAATRSCTATGATWRKTARGHRPRGLDAHRRPGHHGR